MTSQQKEPIDYYRVYVGAWKKDGRLIRLNHRYGGLGLHLYKELNELAMDKKGYYLQFNSLVELATLLKDSSRDCFTKIEKVMNMIQFFVELELYDASSYQKNVITSTELQESYLIVASRRMPLENYPYWLLEKTPAELIKEFAKKEKEGELTLNAPKNNNNVNKIGADVNKIGVNVNNSKTSSICSLDKLDKPLAGNMENDKPFCENDSLSFNDSEQLKIEQMIEIAKAKWIDDNKPSGILHPYTEQLILARIIGKESYFIEDFNQFHIELENRYRVSNIVISLRYYIHWFHQGSNDNYLITNGEMIGSKLNHYKGAMEDNCKKFEATSIEREPIPKKRGGKNNGTY